MQVKLNAVSFCRWAITIVAYIENDLNVLGVDWFKKLAQQIRLKARHKILLIPFWCLVESFFQILSDEKNSHLLIGQMILAKNFIKEGLAKIFACAE